jgi:phosphoribosylaminoimidazole-succinocarboxamide synthase
MFHVQIAGHKGWTAKRIGSWGPHDYMITSYYMLPFNEYIFRSYQEGSSCRRIAQIDLYNLYIPVEISPMKWLAWRPM